ncbi:MAG: YihY/virulence factor BrkB family protein [Chitinophagaceae bacterium]|nr:YihY/virulence factor BrkB family protein [Chitinophagaceae bacterium]
MTKLERLLLKKTPLTFFLQKSKHWHLPGFEGVPLYDVAKFFRKQIKTIGLTERASAISYNFIMAIPPSFLFLFTLIPNLPFISKKSIKFQLHALIVDVVPSKVHNADLIKFIDSFIDGTKIGLISFGLILAFYFASNAMMGIMRSFSKGYIGFEKRKGIQTRWMAIKLTALMFGLVLACLILLVSQGVVLRRVFGIKDAGIRTIIFYARWLFIVAMIFYSIAFIYKYAPAVQKRWKLVSPGAILAALLSILASIGFSYFVNNFGKYNVLYGSIGTIIVLMALIYINSLVLLIGFELNVSIKSLRSIALEREAKGKILSEK